MEEYSFLDITIVSIIYVGWVGGKFFAATKAVAQEIGSSTATGAVVDDTN